MSSSYNKTLSVKDRVSNDTRSVNISLEHDDGTVEDRTINITCNRDGTMQISVSCKSRSAAGSHVGSNRSRSRAGGANTSQHYHRPGSALLDPSSQRSYMSTFVPPPPDSQLSRSQPPSVKDSSHDGPDDSVSPSSVVSQSLGGQDEFAVKRSDDGSVSLGMKVQEKEIVLHWEDGAGQPTVSDRSFEEVFGEAGGQTATTTNFNFDKSGLSHESQDTRETKSGSLLSRTTTQHHFSTAGALTKPVVDSDASAPTGTSATGTTGATGVAGGGQMASDAGSGATGSTTQGGSATNNQHHPSITKLSLTSSRLSQHKPPISGLNPDEEDELEDPVSMEEVTPEKSVIDGLSGETGADQSTVDGMGSDVGIKFKNPGDGNYVMFGDHDNASISHTTIEEFHETSRSEISQHSIGPGDTTEVKTTVTNTTHYTQHTMSTHSVIRTVPGTHTNTHNDTTDMFSLHATTKSGASGEDYDHFSPNHFDDTKVPDGAQGGRKMSGGSGVLWGKRDSNLSKQTSVQFVDSQMGDSNPSTMSKTSGGSDFDSQPSENFPSYGMNRPSLTQKSLSTGQFTGQSKPRLSGSMSAGALGVTKTGGGASGMIQEQTSHGMQQQSMFKSESKISQQTLGDGTTLSTAASSMKYSSHASQSRTTKTMNAGGSSLSGDKTEPGQIGVGNAHGEEGSSRGGTTPFDCGKMGDLLPECECDCGDYTTIAGSTTYDCGKISHNNQQGPESECVCDDQTTNGRLSGGKSWHSADHHVYSVVKGRQPTTDPDGIKSEQTELLCPACKGREQPDDGSQTIRLTEENVEHIVRMMKKSSRRRPVHVRCGSDKCDCAYHYLRDGQLCCTRKPRKKN